MNKWEEILENGTRYLMKSRDKRRIAVYYNDETYMMTHIIWNTNNPHDIVSGGEVIHHIDEDMLNDDIANLQKMTLADHTSLHMLGRAASDAPTQKLRGRVITQAQRDNARIKQTGKKYSTESRAKMSESAKARTDRGKNIDIEAS